MKRTIRYAASGMRSTLFLTALGCLLVAGLAGVIIRPASAARAASTSFNAQPGAAPENYLPQIHELSAAQGASAKAQDQLHGEPLEGGSALELRDGRLFCRALTQEEAHAMRRDPGQQLRVIGGASLTSGASGSPEQAKKGLNIILRGTPQFEQFPEAKAAFLRAAQTWESLIQNPITVVIDVDFGPTHFGKPFPENALGATDFQRKFGPTAYPIIRNALIKSAGSPEEAAIYNALPAQLPTDVGPTTGMIFHVAAMRALGLFQSVADPDAEKATLGMPPAIGFNSTEDFDFDPSDGIKAKRYDFTALATHEIGHALGFFSGVGLQELYPDGPPQLPEVLDIFRFRPGVTSETFATAPRILSSGGEQIFFGGGAELPLSAGRPASTGGDGWQAGHWKDDSQDGHYIGIMHPAFPGGTRYEMTVNDIAAFERIGYRMNPLPNPQEAELKPDDGAIDDGALFDGLI